MQNVLKSFARRQPRGSTALNIPNNDLGLRLVSFDRFGGMAVSDDPEGCALYWSSEAFPVIVMGYHLAAARAAAGFTVPSCGSGALKHAMHADTRDVVSRKAALFAHRIAVGEYMIRAGETPFISADEYAALLRSNGEAAQWHSA